MKPSSYANVRAVSDPATRPGEFAASVSPHRAMRLMRNAPYASVDAFVAWLAFAANQAIVSQVVIAHGAGKLARGHARAIEQTGKLLPESPLRDLLETAAHAEDSVGESIARVGNEWGRAFGRLAFAFPVPDRRQ